MANVSDDSFEVVNYSLRPNKTIARRIIFEGLRRLSRTIDFDTYRYIGMGSIWFVDFMLAQRTLGLRTLISIEAHPLGYQRARFNAPLSCIRVKRGYTTDVLPTLRLSAHRNIIWLDHDTQITGPVLEDIRIIIDQCSEESVLLFTVNASVKDLRRHIDGTNPDKVRSEDILRHLRRRVGDSAPVVLSEQDATEEAFPKAVCEILERRILSSLRLSGRRLRFIKLYDFVYRDGPPMATVGGLLRSTERGAENIRRMTRTAKWPGILSSTIRAPHLTLREKMSLDQMLPSTSLPTLKSVRSKAGFPLTKEQIESYCKYFMYYPTFAEFQL